MHDIFGEVGSRVLNEFVDLYRAWAGIMDVVGPAAVPPVDDNPLPKWVLGLIEDDLMLSLFGLKGGL